MKRRSKEGAIRTEEEEDEDKEAGEEGLTVEKEGTEEEAAENLESELGMEVYGERYEEGEGTIRALGDIEFLTQNAEPSGTTLLDACNRFNYLIRLTRMWTVRHRWPTEARFAFNCYRNWAQLLLHQTGEPSVKIMSLEGVTQGDSLLIVLYRITLVPLAEELRAADSGLLSPFYADDAVFDRSARRSANILKLLMERRPDPGYLPKPAKSPFISNVPGQEEAARREFAAEGIELKCFSGGQYIGAYLGPQEELAAWVKPQVEAWSPGVRVLGKIA